MREKRLKVNIQNIARAAILLGFSIFVFLKIVNKGITLYIHPRFIPLAIFTAAVLCILALVELQKGFSKKGQGAGIFKFSTLAIFITPLLLGTLLPPVSMDSAMARKKGGINVAKQGAVKSKKAGSNDTQQKQEPKVLEITDKNFISSVGDVYEQPDKAKGKLVHLTGFIYKQKEFKENEFAIVRFTVSCCTADAMPAGFVCVHPDAKKFKEDTWYEITGHFVIRDTADGKVPVVEVSKYKQVKPLKDPYVYPDEYGFNPNKK